MNLDFLRYCLDSGKYTSCTVQQTVIILYFMKQYVIDELRKEDHKKIKAYLDENFDSSVINGIYWIPVDRDIITEIQAEHKDCQPFFFAINLEPNLIAFELLVRTKNKIRCSCISYATEKQRNWLIGFADSIFDKLEIQN